MFNGFMYAAPQFTCICPQSGDTYAVRGLSVSEVSRLRNSLINKSQSIKLINDTIWECLLVKPDHITTPEIFKKNLTLLDREALLYGLYISTFGDEQDYMATCSECDHQNNFKVNLSKCFTMEAYHDSESMKKTYKMTKALNKNVHDSEMEAAIEKEEKINKISRGILDKIFLKELPISKINAFIKQPTANDEEDLYKHVLTSPDDDLLTDTLCVSRFEQTTENSKIADIVITDRNDILTGFKSLPWQDKKIILECYQKEFAKYCMTLKHKFLCSKCFHPNELEINTTVEFFRSVGRS